MMNRCYKCGWCGKKHDPACPAIAPGNYSEYERGYRQGRAGKPKESDDPAYSLGWLKGESALEAAENGCDRAIY